MKHKRVTISFVLIFAVLAASFAAAKVFAKEEISVSVTAVSEPAAPENLRESSCTAKTLIVRWDKDEKAESYQLQLKTDGKYKTVGETEKTAFKLKNLESGKKYSLRVRACAVSGGKKLYGKYAYAVVCTAPAEVKVKSASASGNKITVKWKEQSCKGYQLQYSKKSDFSAKTGKTLNKSTVSFTLKNLEENTRYYFRIRAYTVCEGKKYTSGWKKVGVKTGEAYALTSKGYKITVKNGVTYVDGLLIANKTYALPDGYAPGGLTKECSAAFSRMQSAAAKDGVKLYIVSGYRSYETQKRIYNRYVAKDGRALADTYSARPGTSEHQTGLAMDLNSLSSSFGNTKEGKWLEKNSYKYGFIIRYPKGKQSVTGYVYEPWHVRYVGTDKATKIYKSGLCLEEYYGITSKYK